MGEKVDWREEKQKRVVHLVFWSCSSHLLYSARTFHIENFCDFHSSLYHGSDYWMIILELITSCISD